MAHLPTIASLEYHHEYTSKFFKKECTCTDCRAAKSYYQRRLIIVLNLIVAQRLKTKLQALQAQSMQPSGAMLKPTRQDIQEGIQRIAKHELNAALIVIDSKYGVQNYNAADLQDTLNNNITTACKSWFRVIGLSDAQVKAFPGYNISLAECTYALNAYITAKNYKPYAHTGLTEQEIALAKQRASMSARLTDGSKISNVTADDLIKYFIKSGLL